MQPSIRVKVVNAGSLHHGRTGLLEALAVAAGEVTDGGAGVPSPKRWHVVFDWPLGGVAGRAIVAESDLEVASPMPGGDPRMKLRK